MENLILKTIGEDATNMFNDVGHSPEAFVEIKRHLVGRLEVSTKKFHQSQINFLLFLSMLEDFIINQR